MLCHIVSSCFFRFLGFIMAGLELLSPEGLRLDGRKPNELKKIVCKVGVFHEADGSAYIEHGNTKAICSVYGPHESISRGKSKHDRAIINCQYSMATFSTNERRSKPKGDRRSTEITIALEKIFESAILTNLYPRSQIDIYVQVYICYSNFLWFLHCFNCFFCFFLQLRSKLITINGVIFIRC